MIVWLEKALVLATHDRQLAEHGGSAGVRDETLLESVLGRPQQLFAYGDPAPDLAELAASLAFGLVRNHRFMDATSALPPPLVKLSWNSITLRLQPTIWNCTRSISRLPKANSAKRISQSGCARIFRQAPGTSYMRRVAPTKYVLKSRLRKKPAAYSEVIDDTLSELIDAEPIIRPGKHRS